MFGLELSGLASLSSKGSKVSLRHFCKRLQRRAPAIVCEILTYFWSHFADLGFCRCAWTPLGIRTDGKKLKTMCGDAVCPNCKANAIICSLYINHPITCFLAWSTAEMDSWVLLKCQVCSNVKGHLSVLNPPLALGGLPVVRSNSSVSLLPRKSKELWRSAAWAALVTHFCLLNLESKAGFGSTAVSSRALVLIGSGTNSAGRTIQRLGHRHLWEFFQALSAHTLQHKVNHHYSCSKAAVQKWAWVWTFQSGIELEGYILFSIHQNEMRNVSVL